MEKKLSLFLVALLCVLSCSAANPTASTIKRDLVGRTIYSLPNENGQRLSFKIRSQNNIGAVKILKTVPDDKDLLYSVALILKTDVSKYKARIIIRYRLNAQNQWVVQHIQSKQLERVSDGQYDDCVQVRILPYSLIDALYLCNNCDVMLKVEGQVYAWTNGGQSREWQGFSIDVPPNGKEYLYYETTVPYKITKIVRP